MALIEDATDEELSRYAAAIKREQDRRRTLATAEKQVSDLNRAYLSAAGREPGQEWRQPVGAVDAYPEGWEVMFEGRRFISTTPANVWAPNVSGWREVVEEGEAPPEYVPPTGAHDAYQVGDRVTFDGAVYECVLANAVWSPAEYPQAWKQVDDA